MTIADSPLFLYAPHAFRPKKTEVVEHEIVPDFGDVVEVSYRVRTWTGRARGEECGLYEAYDTQAIEIEGAKPHPTPVVESVAMASVPPPVPKYRPFLPDRVIKEGILSAIQLESVIYVGEAHSQFLSGQFEADPSLDFLVRSVDGVKYRKGFSLGDGTGVGKGRQVSGVILDNWLHGRRKAIWVSASDKLIEDARRDWEALGGRKESIVPLGKFKQGEPISLTEGILFVTYATLRTRGATRKSEI